MISLIAAAAMAGAPSDLPVATSPASGLGLAALDPAACETRAGAALLPRAVAVSQMLARWPILVDAAAFSAPPKPLNQRIAQACPNGACKTADAYAALNLAAAQMLQQRQDGRLRLAWVGKGAEPAGRDARIAAFFDLSQDGYAVQCLAQPAEQAQPAPTPVIAPAETVAPRKSLLSRLRIASSLAESEKPEFNRRDPARLSYTDNAAGSGGTFAAKAVIVTPAIAAWGEEQQPMAGFGDLRPFVGYERISATTRASEINNLDLGLRGHFRFAQRGGREPYVGGLTAAWQTDDRLDSSLTRLEGSLALPVRTWVKRGWGGDKPEDCTLCQTPNATLVAEYVEVGDPGAKRALQSLPQYARLGLDAGYDLRLRRGADKASYGVGVQYSRRQDVTGESATADRLTTRASYYPAPTSHYAFSLEFDRGRDLSSLAMVDRWMVTWGYRQ